ncbi:MAG: FHA domain-containing protein [Prevotella sp.]|nr:FHA domain-containing protein [Prevotella sp.]
MIICPSCREEIEDDSHYCDQCGQALLFCNQCGRVGLGRRCTHCGGLMVSPDNRSGSNAGAAAPGSAGLVSNMSIDNVSHTSGTHGIPVLTLANESLNIRIVAMNGAIIGRKKGPYVPFFEQHAYVSGVHAQLKYIAGMGWSVTDKHSSNGTKLNQRPVQPDVEMTLNNGDVLTIANINLQVIIR